MTYTTRVDGMAKEGHWALRPRTRVWSMHSATRLVPLSNTGVPVTETVVGSLRTEAVYKITGARIPTLPRLPRLCGRLNHSLDDLKQALRSAENGGRTVGRRRTGTIHETRPLRRGRWGSIPAPCKEMNSSAISGRCVWWKRDGTKREGEAASLGLWALKTVPSFFVRTLGGR